MSALQCCARVHMENLLRDWGFLCFEHQVDSAILLQSSRPFDSTERIDFLEHMSRYSMTQDYDNRCRHRSRDRRRRSSRSFSSPRPCFAIPPTTAQRFPSATKSHFIQPSPFTPKYHSFKRIFSAVNTTAPCTRVFTAFGQVYSHGTTHGC